MALRLHHLAGVAMPGAFVVQRLEHLWERPHTFHGWISSVDHKDIGKRYLVTAFVFLLIGGIEAILIRTQLAQPDQHVLTPEAYDQIFTMDGITMTFWVRLANPVRLRELPDSADERSVSGDTACADHEIAKRIRHMAGLDPEKGEFACKRIIRCTCCSNGGRRPAGFCRSSPATT